MYREELLSYLLKYYKKELLERVEEVMPKIELKWAEGFERWLLGEKPKPITSSTLRDYRNVWIKCLGRGLRHAAINAIG